jgi:hypothetical protein
MQVPKAQILTNHVGYDPRAPKIAIVQSTAPLAPLRFEVARATTGETVLAGVASERGCVDGWKGRAFQVLDFSALTEPGVYVIEAMPADAPPSAAAEADAGISNLVVTDDAPVDDSFSIRSHPIEIAPHHLLLQTLSDIVYYFRSQRHTGLLAEADRHATFVDQPGRTADVRGGWSDATADWSKNLSHLDHGIFTNPQQAALPVWTMTLAAERLAGSGVPGEALLRMRLREEAACGADFLARMQDADGCFREMAILHRSPDAVSTVIGTNTYGIVKELQANYRAGWRQGAGMAIAALARCAALGLAGEVSAATYLRKARRGFGHLERHGLAYLDDGRENIIDDYCALLAATELHAATESRVAAKLRAVTEVHAATAKQVATGQPRDPAAAHQSRNPKTTGRTRYLKVARQRAANLVARLCDSGPCAGWLRADDAGDRPWFHASDEGMPLVALLRYLQVETDAERGATVRAALARMLAFQVRLSAGCCNPFRYARQWVRRATGRGAAAQPMSSWPHRPLDESQREPYAAFFLPHDNETGYWWQGENARIASLAAAWYWCALECPEVIPPGAAPDAPADGEKVGQASCLSPAGASAHAPTEARKVGQASCLSSAPPTSAPTSAPANPLLALAQGQLDWVLGLNPFDTCMFHGRGRNNREYTLAIPNAPGGILNGITADPDDERDIAFLSGPHGADGKFTWRWAEQWIPHTAWFLLAVTLRDRVLEGK